jgi:uncharacterized membrane protein YfcA
VTTAQIVAIVIAVIIGAVIKSVTGMGLPLIAVPIITVFAGAETAIATLAIPNTVQNLVLVIKNRSHRRQSVGLVRFALAGIAGAVIGTLALGTVPEWTITLLLILIVSTYLISVLLSPEYHLDETTAHRWSGVTGTAAGLFQGASGISGPLVASWFHALRLERGPFVFSIATVFLVSGGTQALVLARTGLLDGRLIVSAVLTAIVVATIPLGPVLSARLGSRGFDRAVLALLAASTIALVIELVISALA